MKIILFGGAFDPPHLGHQRIAKKLLEKGIADEVWYVPAKEHPFSKKMSSTEDRLKMLELSINGDSRIKIEKFELEKEGTSYSFETLDFLSQKYSDDDFSWLIGSDNLAKFHLWDDSQGRGYKELLAEYRFYVYPRVGSKMEPLYEGMIDLSEVEGIEPMGESSTEVREKTISGESVENLVKKEVAEYIQEKELYR